MTIGEVTARVAEIDAVKGDDEVAHGKEDDLWEDVLRAIAKGAPDPDKLASEALKTKDIEFSRWCA